MKVQELGKKEDIFGADELVPLDASFRMNYFDSYGTGRPSQFPALPQDQSLVCGYDQGLGERLIVCQSLDDMQQLWDSYYRGGALQINWYIGNDVGFVIPISNTTPMGEARSSGDTPN